MTDDYSLNDVPTCRGLAHKPIKNSNLLASLTDDQATDWLVMPVQMQRVKFTDAEAGPAETNHKIIQKVQ